MHEPPTLAQPRRFRLYNVGLLKSGTTSIAALFHRHRSAHEFMAREVFEHLEARADGRASERELCAFLHRRDAIGALEMDSAGFHHHHIELLVAEFADARFVFTLRDPRSWLRSLIAYALDSGPRGGHFYGWGRAQLGLPFDLPYRDQASRQALRRCIPQCVPRFLRYWLRGNEAVLSAVPSERLLIVHTHAISRSLASLAHFAGVGEETLDATRSHELQASDRKSLDEWLDPGAIGHAFDTLERERETCSPLLARSVLGS